MLLSLVAVAGAFFLVVSSNALSLDSSHLARHQQIAARHSPRAPVSARCKKRNSTATSASAHPPSSSQAPKPSPSSSTSSGSASTSSGSGKAGIAWAYGDEPSLKNFMTEKVSFLYTWNPAGPKETYGRPFFPMLWGTDQLSQFKDLVKPGYATHVLSFNEPDIPSQANLDPNTAAQIWMANGQPLRAQGYQTISPAMAFSSTWLQEFFKACIGCQWDGMAAHIYTTDAQDMINYLTTLHTTFNMDIMVTEFACQSFTGAPQCDLSQAMAFMSTVTKWMDETPWIARYSAYGVMTAAEININSVNALMNEDGTPTALGRIYLGI